MLSRGRRSRNKAALNEFGAGSFTLNLKYLQKLLNKKKMKSLIKNENKMK